MHFNTGYSGMSPCKLTDIRGRIAYIYHFITTRVMAAFGGLRSLRARYRGENSRWVKKRSGNPSANF